jgi:putative redox protein
MAIKTATLVYKGNLECELKHERSGTQIITDAPVDNQGRGSAFSPTDLVTAAAASCIITTLGIAAQTRSWKFDGTEMDIVKTMASDPRRIAAIDIDVRFSENYSDADKESIKRIAMNCPVIVSLSPDVKKNVRFFFPDGSEMNG